MKKFSSAEKAAQGVRGARFALVEHEHTEYVPKASNALVEVSSDILFSGTLYGTAFSLPSVATIAERDAFDTDLRYEGFLLYVEDVQETYQLRGGIDNGSWISIAGASGSWGSITGSITDQNDLIALLSGYSTVGHTHSIAEVVDLQTTLDGKASSSHTHEIEDVNGLGTVLTNKTDVGHVHDIGSVNGLIDALDSKASFMHTHVIAEISNLGIFNTEADGLVPKTGTSSQSAFLRADGTWVIPTIATPEIVWGGLTGTLADQVDLQTALDEKAANTVFTDLEAGLVPPAINGTDTFLRADGTWSSVVTETAWGSIVGLLGDQTDLANVLDSFSSSIVGINTALAGKVDDSQVLTNVPLGAVFTDTTYSVFNSTTNGLTPASGGGTTNFLRADGTWNKPTGGEWGQITGTLSAQTDLQTALNGKANSSHTHTISAVTGLQAALDAKVDDAQVLTNVPAGAVFTDTTYSVFNSTTNGLTPASGGGTANFLRADGSWATPGGGAWGQISGTLADQTDLQTALDSKANSNQVLTNVPANAVFTDTTYNVFTALANGLVPSSGGGTENFLRADGSWATIENTSITTDVVPLTVINGNAENGVVGWINEVGELRNIASLSSFGFLPYDGPGVFSAVAGFVSSIVYQRIDISSIQNFVNIEVNWGQSSFNSSGLIGIGIRALAQNLTVLAEIAPDVINTPSTVWTDRTAELLLPASTVFVDIVIEITHNVTGNPTGYVDGITAKVTTQTSLFIEEAPVDGQQYARSNNNWIPVETFPDAPADNTQYARANNNWVPVEASAAGTFALIDMGSFTAANSATLNAGSFV